MNLFPWRRRDRDLEDEIQSHLSMATRDRVDRGESRASAYDAARREFGNVGLVQETTRGVWRHGWLDRLGQDLRYALRQLSASPGFTAAAVLTLALGIGANAAIFSVVNGVLLNPLPYRNADRLMWGWGRTPDGHVRAAVSPPDFQDYRDQNRSFEHFAALFVMGTMPQNWGRQGGARQLQAGMVTAGFFETLGFQPILGRSFTRADEQSDRPRVVILSHHLWRQEFGGDPNVTGQTARLDTDSVTIVGVMPEALDYPRHADFWMPTPLNARGMQRRMGHNLRVIGLLKQGVSSAQAQADLNAVAARLGQIYPETDKGWGIQLDPMRDALVGPVRSTLWLLQGAVVLVLLIACVNIANLLLARYAAREREISVRTAIGAGRFRILGQLLTENLLLTAVAGALAVAVAWWGVDLLRGLAPPGLPRLSEIRVDGRVLAFTALVSTATALFFGLTPAWLATAAGSLLTLRDGGKSSASRRRHRFGSALVVSETALSICLLIGATLLIESLWKTVHADPGFRTRGIISTQMMLPANNGLGRNLAFVEQVIESVRALPGVDAAGVISELPLSGEHNDTGFSIVEHPPRSPQQRDGADFRRVTPDYFDTMGIALLRGRSFDRHDRPDSQPVVIIDEPFARSFFPGEEPIGKHIQLWAACEIVGVVSGVRTHSLQLPPRPILYLPASQEMPDSLHVVVRAAGDPAALVNPIRGVVAARNPDVALSAFQSMDDLIAGSLAAQRFTSLLLGAFAALALVLAMAGVYGVFSYVVSQQTRTIGVRMALGAQPGQMLWMVLRRGICLSAAGAALGLSAAIFLVQVLATQLYEVQPRDPITFAASALALIGVAVGACALPARRAMRVDPLVALRYE